MPSLADALEDFLFSPWLQESAKKGGGPNMEVQISGSDKCLPTSILTSDIKKQELVS